MPRVGTLVKRVKKVELLKRVNQLESDNKKLDKAVKSLTTKLGASKSEITTLKSKNAIHLTEQKAKTFKLHNEIDKLNGKLEIRDLEERLRLTTMAAESNRFKDLLPRLENQIEEYKNQIEEHKKRITNQDRELVLLRYGGIV